jgi:hypothetical protein
MYIFIFIKICLNKITLFYVSRYKNNNKVPIYVHSNNMYECTLTQINLYNNKIPMYIQYVYKSILMYKHLNKY